MSRLCMGYTDILPFAFAWKDKINFLVFNTGKTEFLQLSALLGLSASVLMCNVFRH